MALRPNAGHGLLILEVSRSHTTHHSRQDSSGRVISSSQRPLPDNTQHSQQINIHGPGGIRTHNLSRRAAFLPRTLQNYWTICSCATNHQIWNFCTLIKNWGVIQSGRWNSELLSIIIPWKILIWARISAEQCAEICFLYIILPSVLSERSTYKCATECAPVKIDTSSQTTCKLYKCLHTDQFVLGQRRAPVFTHISDGKNVTKRPMMSHNKSSWVQNYKPAINYSLTKHALLVQKNISNNYLGNNPSFKIWPKFQKCGVH